MTCSIAAIAARNDWFHDDDGIHEAVELLATGQNPEITGDIRQALARTSELGHDLTSAFSAAMAQPDLVKFGMGYDSANGSDEDARNFAKRTINLANRLNAERRATTLSLSGGSTPSMELLERSTDEFNTGGNTMIAAELLWGAYAQLSLALPELRGWPA